MRTVAGGAHRPGDVPASPKIRFTEDTVEMKLGDGRAQSPPKLGGD